MAKWINTKHNTEVAGITRTQWQGIKDMTIIASCLGRDILVATTNSAERPNTMTIHKRTNMEENDTPTMVEMKQWRAYWEDSMDPLLLIYDGNHYNAVTVPTTLNTHTQQRNSNEDGSETDSDEEPTTKYTRRTRTVYTDSDEEPTNNHHKRQHTSTTATDVNTDTESDNDPGPAPLVRLYKKTDNTQQPNEECTKQTKQLDHTTNADAVSQTKAEKQKRPHDDNTNVREQIKRNKTKVNTTLPLGSRSHTEPTKDRSEPATIEDSLTQQQEESNQAHKTKTHNNDVNSTNDCQQTNAAKRKLEGAQSPRTKKRGGERHTAHNMHTPTQTPGTGRNVITMTGTRNTTHEDRAQRAANERKKRQSETMHENPRKHKK